MCLLTCAIVTSVVSDSGSTASRIIAGGNVERPPDANEGGLRNRGRTGSNRGGSDAANFGILFIRRSIVFLENGKSEQSLD